MSEQEELLRTVITSLEGISMIIDGKKDVEEFLAKTSPLSGSEVFKKVVQLVDNLYDSVNKFRTDFLKGCNVLCQSSDTETSTALNKTDIRNSNDECTKNATDLINQAESTTDIVKEDDVDSQTGSDSASVVKKSAIRLIDINKLIDTGAKTFGPSPSPKQKKSVKFDNSVVILESSEEESSKKFKENGKKKHEKRTDRHSKELELITLSDSASSEDSQPVRDKKQRRSNRKSSRRTDSASSEDSQPVHDKKQRRSNRKSSRRTDSASSEDSQPVHDKKQRRSNRKSSRRRSSSVDSSESDFEDGLTTRQMKSRRAQNKERIENKFSNLKAAVFKRRKHLELKRTSKVCSDKSDSEDDEKLSKIKAVISRNGKKSDEDSDKSVSDKESEVVKKLPPLKLKISLPRIECEKLEEIYLKEKEKRSDSKRIHSQLGNSSDSDRPLSKKVKCDKKMPEKGSDDSDSCLTEKPNKIEVNSSSNVDKADNEKLKCINQSEMSSNVEDENMNNDKANDDDKVNKQPTENEELSISKEKVDENGINNEEKEKSEEELPSFQNNVSSNRMESKPGSDDEDERDEKLKEKAKSSDHEEVDEIKKTDNNTLKKVVHKNSDTSDTEDKGNSEKRHKKLDNGSDSEEGFDAFCKKKNIPKKELIKKARNRLKKAVISDSDSDFHNSEKEMDDSNEDEDEKKKSKSKRSKKKQKQVISDSDSDAEYKNSDKDESSSDSDNLEKEEEEKPEPKKSRGRIKRTKESSSEDEDKSTRKHIRKVIDRDSLSETTKKAEAEEKERKARIMEKQEKYNQIFDLKTDAKIDKVVLDYNEETKEAELVVHEDLVKKLKPHQASGIQFMWDACFESLKRTKKNSGSGCILAHCMGLGKTLQVITLVHTLLTNSEKTKVEKVMVVCPVNTVLNWKSEFKKWISNEDEIDVYELVSCKQNYERQYTIKEWHENGGVLIIGYTMFRNLSSPDNKKISKKMRTVFQEGLVDPGPDLVVCDEGHLLKNEKTNISIAMNRIKTLRRIVLTGTPLQNNLREYWCMVQFIKPNLLGTYKEYLNRFVNPIINGQYTDSTPHDIVIMRRRSHVLHKLLDGVVQRRDYAVLEPYLPPKYEYVLFVPLTEMQVNLYQHYMDKFSRRNDGSNRTSFLFTDFQEFQRICTHPRVLLDKSLENDNKRDRLETSDEDEGSLKDFIDDGSESEATTSSDGNSESNDSDASIKSNKKKPRGRCTRARTAEKRQNGEIDESDVEETKPKEWWQQYCDGPELEKIENSGKMLLLFELLKECEQIGDKVLIFSQSLYTLNCIEYFLEKIDDATQAGNTESVGGYSGAWALGLDYFRLDGSSSCDNRAAWCDSFNNPKNTRARLFLISTRAGGLGINLVAANRVIIFDVSWNPSHDIQSIYRVYRFGQTKPCYVYRFVSYGTMEMKIYERQVTKQAISKRVIDEQQIDRHYSQNDIQELYKIDLAPTERPIPMVPKDVLLGEMLQKYDKHLFKYHEHQSLLENKQDEELNEEERKAAWEEFENEKVIRNYNASVSSIAGIGGFGLDNMAVNFSPQAISLALMNIVRKDNPTWSEIQIKGVIPALVQQLRVQLSEGDYSMYNRVQNEIRLYQAEAQKLKQYYQQQHMLRMLQAQNPQLFPNQMLNPYSVGNVMGGTVGPSGRPQQQMPSTSDIIDLND